MRYFSLLLSVLIFGFHSIGASGSEEDTALDTLLDRLAISETPADARDLEKRIRTHWQTQEQDSIAYFMDRARNAIWDDNPDHALTHLRYAILFAPDHLHSRLMRAQILWRKNWHADAIIDLQQIVSREPRHFDALMLLGRIFLEINDKMSAYGAFEKALAAHPHLNEARTFLQQLKVEVKGREI